MTAIVALKFASDVYLLADTLVSHDYAFTCNTCTKAFRGNDMLVGASGDGAASDKLLRALLSLPETACLTPDELSTIVIDADIQNGGDCDALMVNSNRILYVVGHGGCYEVSNSFAVIGSAGMFLAGYLHGYNMAGNAISPSSVKQAIAMASTIPILGVGGSTHCLKL